MKKMTLETSPNASELAEKEYQDQVAKYKELISIQEKNMQKDPNNLKLNVEYYLTGLEYGLTGVNGNFRFRQSRMSQKEWEKFGENLIDISNWMKLTGELLIRHSQ